MILDGKFQTAIFSFKLIKINYFYYSNFTIPSNFITTWQCLYFLTFRFSTTWKVYRNIFYAFKIHLLLQKSGHLLYLTTSAAAPRYLRAKIAFHMQQQSLKWLRDLLFKLLNNENIKKNYLKQIDLMYFFTIG